MENKITMNKYEKTQLIDENDKQNQKLNIMNEAFESIRSI
jgi:hypothetical protein